ncbi:MAG TPA: macro domain-containing protein [Clostridiales bacterium]|nr:macro domain-containing protein [Clostridiales bacterium]
MLSYLKGDLLSSPAQVQVNTVNTVGVMGKGIALQFKNKYPAMFEAYQNVCEKHLLDVGKLYLWKSTEKWILMFPTKKHWRNPSKIEYIESGLKKFVENYERIGIESIAFPKLGCGNGNLDWNVVRPIMEKYLKPLPITIYIYVDNYELESLEHEDAKFTSWIHSKPRDMSFNILKEELQEILKNNNDIIYSDGTTKHVEWNNDKITIQNGHTIEIEESNLCDFWDYIKNVGVIDIKKIPEMYIQYSDVMLEIFKKLKYLQPILVASNEKGLNDGLGYQYIEGK